MSLIFLNFYKQDVVIQFLMFSWSGVIFEIKISETIIGTCGPLTHLKYCNFCRSTCRVFPQKLKQRAILIAILILQLLSKIIIYLYYLCMISFQLKAFEWREKILKEKYLVFKALSSNLGFYYTLIIGSYFSNYYFI